MGRHRRSGRRAGKKKNQSRKALQAQRSKRIRRLKRLKKNKQRMEPMLKRCGTLGLMLALLLTPFVLVTSLDLVAQEPGPKADIVVTPPLPPPPKKEVEEEEKVEPVIVDEFILDVVDNEPIDSEFVRVAVDAGKKIRISVKGTAVGEGKKVAWKIYPPNPDATLEEDTQTASFVSQGVGRYWLVASLMGPESTGPPLLKTVLVEVGNVPDVDPEPSPKPPGPTPPGPTPPPGPVVDPPPVALDGFRALLIYDDVKGIPTVFASTEVRQYLDTHVVKGEDGSTPEKRIWSYKVNPVGDFDSWQLYHAKWLEYKATIPPGQPIVGCVMGNGKNGYVGKPPETIAEMMALCKKFGG